MYSLTVGIRLYDPFWIPQLHVTVSWIVKSSYLPWDENETKSCLRDYYNWVSSMQILQLHDLMQDNCLLSFFPFFCGGGWAGREGQTYTLQTPLLYTAHCLYYLVSCSHNNMWHTLCNLAVYYATLFNKVLWNLVWPVLLWYGILPHLLTCDFKHVHNMRAAAYFFTSFQETKTKILSKTHHRREEVV